MTPLEALERIKKKHYFVDFELDTTVGKDCKEELDIIETALKRLDKCDKIVGTTAYDKVLEALEKLHTMFLAYAPRDIREDKELNEDLFECIKTALKEYELMKQTKIIFADKKFSDDDLEKLKNQRMFVGSLEQGEIKPLFDEETQKKLKALEIIKRKGIDIETLRWSNTVAEYNSNAKACIGYTQEEYETIVGVIL